MSPRDPIGRPTASAMCRDCDATPPAAPAAAIAEDLRAFAPVYYAYAEALARGDDAERLRLRARLAEYDGIFREAAASPAAPAALAVCLAKLRRVLSEPAPSPSGPVA